MCIFHAGRLRASGWRFATGEPANQQAAATRFARLGYLPCPFAMWLPRVPAFRGRTKSIALRLAERVRDCGLHPLRYMSASDAARCRSAACEHPPIAEQWLAPVDGAMAEPWIYDPMQGAGWLKQIDRLELLVRAGVRRATKRADPTDHP